jgi:hypothetical protein
MAVAITCVLYGLNQRKLGYRFPAYIYVRGFLNYWVQRTCHVSMFYVTLRSIKSQPLVIKSTVYLFVAYVD